MGCDQTEGWQLSNPRNDQQVSIPSPIGRLGTAAGCEPADMHVVGKAPLRDGVGGNSEHSRGRGSPGSNAQVEGEGRLERTTQHNWEGADEASVPGAP